VLRHADPLDTQKYVIYVPLASLHAPVRWGEPLEID
jgi:hypothetical protein